VSLLDRAGAGHVRAQHHFGRRLEDLGDDRLAHRLHANPVLAPVFNALDHQHRVVRLADQPVGALEAITGPQDAAEAMKKSFRERRDLIVRLLNEVPGVSCQVPGGAFYVWRTSPRPAAVSAPWIRRTSGGACSTRRGWRCSPTSISAPAWRVKASTCASRMPPPGRRSRRVQRMADFIRKNTKKAA